MAQYEPSLMQAAAAKKKREEGGGEGGNLLVDEEGLTIGERRKRLKMGLANQEHLSHREVLDHYTTSWLKIFQTLLLET